MEVIKYLSGGAAFRAKYQVAVTHSVAGIHTLMVADGTAGLAIGTVTSAADMVGITLDTATYVTAQQTDGSTAERQVLVDIRPDAVIKARLSGTTAAGGALVPVAVTTATTDGLDVTTASAWNSPSYDEGTAFAYTGVNAGQIRKLTAVGATSGTVTVAFEGDHQVGDQFIRFPFFPMDVGSASLTLCTELTEVRANVAIAATSACEFQPIELLAGTVANEGTTKSFVLFTPKDHILNRLA